MSDAPEMDEVTRWTVISDRNNTTMPFFLGRHGHGRWEFRRAHGQRGLIRYATKEAAKRAADRLNGDR